MDQRPAVTQPVEHEPNPMGSAPSSKVEPRSRTSTPFLPGSSGFAPVQQAAPTVPTLRTPSRAPVAEIPKDTLATSPFTMRRLWAKTAPLPLRAGGVAKLVGLVNRPEMN